MTLFHSQLTSLVYQNLQYLNKRTEVLTGNIARSDIPGEKRKELKPFREIIKNKGPKASDVLSENRDIEREYEILELNHNTLNHQALIDMLSMVYKLYNTVIREK